MDEFLVSGESHLRNLERGLARAGTLGDRARGRIPARPVRPHRADAADPGPRRDRPGGGVAWGTEGDRPNASSGGRRPDGSRVLTEYLAFGYSLGWALSSRQQDPAGARGLPCDARSSTWRRSWRPSGCSSRLAPITRGRTRHAPGAARHRGRAPPGDDGSDRLPLRSPGRPRGRGFALVAGRAPLVGARAPPPERLFGPHQPEARARQGGGADRAVCRAARGSGPGVRLAGRGVGSGVDACCCGTGRTTRSAAARTTRWPAMWMHDTRRRGPSGRRSSRGRSRGSGLRWPNPGPCGSTRRRSIGKASPALDGEWTPTSRPRRRRPPRKRKTDG